MKKIIYIILVTITLAPVLHAQEEDEDGKKGFQKENLFTGGSIALSFFNRSFLAGANPVFGYSIARWADVGLAGNYTYSSDRNYYSDIKFRQNIYGGGAFLRLFPLKFFYAQAQLEHNWISARFVGDPTVIVQAPYHAGANSLLVGAGLATGRDPQNKTVYGTISLLVDVANDPNSPYMDANGRALPIFRAGLHIPLFQKNYDR